MRMANIPPNVRMSPQPPPGVMVAAGQNQFGGPVMRMGVPQQQQPQRPVGSVAGPVNLPPRYATATNAGDANNAGGAGTVVQVSQQQQQPGQQQVMHLQVRSNGDINIEDRQKRSYLLHMR